MIRRLKPLAHTAWLALSLASLVLFTAVSQPAPWRSSVGCKPPVVSTLAIADETIRLANARLTRWYTLEEYPPTNTLTFSK